MLSQAKFCPNLKALFGDVYKIRLDESWRHEEVQDRPQAKIWCYELRGLNGMIYPGGEQTLVAYTDNQGVRTSLKHLGFQVLQWGQEEGSFKVSIRDVAKLASILKLKKKQVAKSS